MRRREREQLLRRAAEQGWRVVKNAHSCGWKLLAPDGKTIVTVHETPSDYRAEKNDLARMRRAGFRE